VLDSVWPGGSADAVLPVDPAYIALKLGIDVYETFLDQDVFALLVKEPGQDPAIALNEADSENRKRFSCAHELGHFIRRTDGDLGLEQYAYLDKRSALSSSGTDFEEVYANAFSASLLMPSEAVKRFVKLQLHPSEMAVRFDVSSDAMRYRLENLGYRNSGQAS
jgi:Zn-dependent peptidase ImmA (M78 family)